MKKNKLVAAAIAVTLAGMLVVILRNAGPTGGPKQDTIDVRRSGNVAGAFKLQVEPAVQSVPVDSPVVVTARLVNVSEISRFIEITHRPTGIYVIVRHSNGRLAALTGDGIEKYAAHIDDRPFMQRLFLPRSYRSRMQGIAGSTASYAVSGGGSQDFDIEVSRFYDMSQSDTYTIESEVPLVTTNDSLVGNVVQVEVK